MKKATRDFAAWIKNIDGLEKATADYERGLITLKEYISLAQDKEIENLKNIHYQVDGCKNCRPVFATLEEASGFANKVLRDTGCVLAVTETKRKVTHTFDV